MMEIVFREDSYRIIGACMKVHQAKPFIHQDNIEQVKNYLKSTKMQLGLLVNFGEKSLTYKRVLNPHHSSNSF
jgi:hypothetical protein